MLKIAKKYKTNLAAIRLSPGVKTTLPVWYHPAAETRPIVNVYAKCLLRKHEIKTVANLIKTANKATDRTRNGNHIPDQTCVCIECTRDRLEGCRNLHACALEAETRPNDIAPKYNPIAFDPHDNLSLTPDRKTRNTATKEEGEGILFDPTITCKDSIAKCFRVFTNPERISPNSASCRPQHGTYLDHLEMRVYTDGACMNNGKQNAKCGSGIWIEDGHVLNKALKVPGPNQSNQIGEIAAAAAAVESLPNYCKPTIVTDSKYVMKDSPKT